MKRKFKKGEVMFICKNGIQTNQNTNLDQDRELGVGDVFEWRLSDKVEFTKFKLLSLGFPLMVEEVFD